MGYGIRELDPFGQQIRISDMEPGLSEIASDQDFMAYMQFESVVGEIDFMEGSTFQIFHLESVISNLRNTFQLPTFYLSRFYLPWKFVLYEKLFEFDQFES